MNDLLRNTIKQILHEQWWEETYDHLMIDDDSFNKESILVNDDTKKQIKNWLQKMKLA